MESIGREQLIEGVRKALLERSGKSWSVRGGEGTAWGWVKVKSPPRRCTADGEMTAAEREELAKLLALPGVEASGVRVPDSRDYYLEYAARAKGETPTVLGKPYWD